MPNKPHKKPNYFRAERQVHPELKNYYHINHFRGLSDSNFFLLCVDTQTLDLLHSLKEPKYYARWKVEVNNRDERISTDEDKAFVDYVWGKLEEQLADVACLNEITEVLKEMLAVQKMALAAKTDGIIRDHYPDPARLDEFAAKVGLTVDDLPTSDNDLSWPELSRFDDLGDNRKMIDEVPSVWISEGMLTSKSMADMYADTMYATPISDPTGTITPVWVGFANSVANNLERVDLALRHINAKFSRNGQVQLDLAEEPFTYNILTGARVSIRSLLRQYAPTLVNLWPIKAYTSGGSIFTWGPLKSDDPQKYDPDVSLPQTSWLNKSLHESMRSMATSETILQPGLPLVGNTPAIPATPISAPIPSVPFYAGTTDIVWPGTYGVGLADMLKLPEKPKSYTAAAMGLPYGVDVVGGKVFAVLPGNIRMQIFPVLIMPKLSKLTGDSITSVLDAAFRLVKPTAEELASTDEDEFAKAQVDNSIWARISGIFTSKTPNITKINFIDLFNQFFRLADDDPNLKSPDIVTHAQILNNFNLSGDLEAQLIRIADALEDCCGATSNAAIQAGLNQIATELACLVLTQQEINKVEGGADPGCVPVDPTVPIDCQAIAEAWDYLVDILDWLVWALESFGGMLAGPIVTALKGFRWFATILVAAGLAEPSPAEEPITIPVGVVAMLTYVVEKMITLGAAAARDMVNALKANRTAIINLLCGATDITIETQTDTAINLIKDSFADAGVKVIIQDLLENYLKSPITQGVILSK